MVLEAPEDPYGYLKTASRPGGKEADTFSNEKPRIILGEFPKPTKSDSSIGPSGGFGSGLEVRCQVLSADKFSHTTWGPSAEFRGISRHKKSLVSIRGTENNEKQRFSFRKSLFLGAKSKVFDG